MDEFKVEYCGPFVNMYLIDKAYGGPEEGGWWYEYGKTISSVQCRDEEQAQEHKAMCQKMCDDLNSQRRSDIGSVLSEGMYVIYIEDEPGADFQHIALITNKENSDVIILD